MTLQEYFDKTVKHLAEQKTASVGSTSCMYEDEAGRRCAVGVHIPDGHPGLKFEGDIYELLAAFPDLQGVACPREEIGIELAHNLQVAHDAALIDDEDSEDDKDPLQVLKDHLRYTAYKHKLDGSSIDLITEWH